MWRLLLSSPILWALCVCLIISQSTFASPPELTSTTVQIDLFERGSLYRATTPPKEAPTAPALLLDNLTPTKTFDRINGGRYWLSLPLSNQSDMTRWSIDPFNAVIDRISTYVYHNGQLIQEETTGYLHPHNYSLHYGADIDIPKNSEVTLLLYVESRYFSGEPRFELSPRAVYANKVAKENSWIIACLGGVIILALYNLFISVWMRDKSFFYYSLYLVMSVIAWAAAFNALGEWFGIYYHALLLSPFYLVITLNVLYLIHFLDLPTHNPKLAIWAYIVVVWSGLMGFAYPFFSPGTYMVIQALTSFTWIITGLTCGIVRLKAGYQPARFFVAAFAVIFLGALMSIAPALGMKPLAENNYIATLVAQTLDILLLSLAIADRFNLLRREKQNALKQLYESEQRKTHTEREAKKVLKEANEKLAKALDISKQESERKSNFLRMVSHELRTPLHSIASSIEQFNEAITPYEQKDTMRDIHYGASRLCTQVDNLVLMAETDDDRMESESYPFEIGPILDKLYKNASELIVGSEVELRYRKSNSVPRAFQGDSYLIGHLLRTVLENACKFTDEGEILFAIDWNPDEKTLDVIVKDDGCGMTEEQQQVVFEGFIQVSQGLTRQSEGLGLGLTLCHRLSHILDATLSINSSPGNGTQISFQIPLTPLEGSTVPQHNTDIRGRVLVVEDNIVNAKVMERMVTKLGYPVDVAHSGLEALAAVDKQTYSVILMDVQMPDMDGITATQRIRSRQIKTPVVAVTANSDPEVRRNCRQAGMNDFMVKPVKLAEMQQTLMDWQMVSLQSAMSDHLH